MRILIDTNIYLNFYRLTNNQSLELIDQLIKLIKDKKIELVVTRQIQDEFYRDRNIVFKAYLDDLDVVLKKDLRVPKFIELNKKSKNFTALSEKMRRALTEFKEEYQNKVINPKSQINKKMDSLFKLSIFKEETKEILELAYYRTIRGNPPRKGNRSFGDAIIWKTILEYFCEKDLVIISGDGDFESETNKGEVNEFLFKEFSSINERNVKLYKNLGEFINTITKRQTISKKTIIEEKEINKLSSVYNLNSGAITSFSGGISNHVISKGSILGNSGITLDSGVLVARPATFATNYNPAILTVDTGTTGTAGYLTSGNINFIDTSSFVSTGTTCPNCKG